MVNDIETEILHAELLKILLEFDRVCKQLKIKYSLSGGTLLGAVRHKGFIPWDDDIDVLMVRSDYEIFCKKAESILENKYFLQTYKTDKNYPHNFAKLLNTEIIVIERANMDIDIKRGLFIDIFPVDMIPDNMILRLFYVMSIRLLKIIKYSANYSSIVKNSANSRRKYIKILFYPLAVSLGSNNVNKIENFIRTYFNKNNKNVMKETYGDYDPGIAYVFAGKEVPFSLFEEYIELEFEGNRFLSIKNFDYYLRRYYGNYMQLPPVEERVSHHDLLFHTDLEMSKSEISNMKLSKWD